MSREKSSPSAQYRSILVSAFSPLFERAVFLRAASYKKECQEKNLLHRLNTAPFLSRHSAHCLSVRSSSGPRPLFRLRVRSADTLPPPVGFFPGATAPIVF